MKRLLFIFLIMFSFIGLVSCSKEKETTSSSSEASKPSTTVVDDYKLTVVAPMGAPAIALGNIAVNDKDNYSFIAAKTITEQFAAEEKDIVIAPINGGAAQFKKGASKYKLGAVLTWGNLVIATQRADVETINDINGKDVTLFGENTINSSFAKHVLNSLNITPNYVKPLAEASDTNALLISDSNAIVLTAEPAVTAASIKLLNEKNVTVKKFPLHDLYKDSNGNVLDYTQAALFIKESTITNHKTVVDKYLADLEESIKLFGTDLDKSVENVVSLGINGLTQAPVLKKAIPGCNIKYKSAKDAKSAIEATANIDLAKFGGAVPSDEFYYNK